MPNNDTLLPDPERLRMICVAAAGAITLTDKTATPEAYCLLCGEPSGRVHSRYVRATADLPWQVILITL